MSQDEKNRFEELIKNVPNFFMPKRCGECRRKRRTERNLERIAPVLPAAPPPLPPSPPPPPPAVETPKPEEPKKEIRLILATKDFEDLVHGQHVVWQGVRVILAEIGFDVMRKAIDRAETEKAKAFFQKNGQS
jgi:hypothetical protein